jgi:hypothetical protein
LRLLSVLTLLPLLAWAQAPRVSTIDFYGLHHLKEERLRKALGFTEGDPLPASKSDVEERLEEIDGVVQARLEAVCCDSAGRSAVYIGIEEKGAPHYELREDPMGTPLLPDVVVENYTRFLRALADASATGEAAEDLTRGESHMENARCRALQDLFSGYAGLYQKQLRAVLADSANEFHRAAAACILAYSKDKASIVPHLQRAMTDPDAAVRNNALRALTALAVYARLNPEAGVRVEPTWFIEMLNSLRWNDRRQAARALVTITDARDMALLGQVRERALPALVEMARWRHLDHALPAFLLLGRIADLGEQQIQEEWTSGDREKLIKMVLKPARKKDE